MFFCIFHSDFRLQISIEFLHLFVGIEQQFNVFYVYIGIVDWLKFELLVQEVSFISFLSCLIIIFRDIHIVLSLLYWNMASWMQKLCFVYQFCALFRDWFLGWFNSNALNTVRINFYLFEQNITRPAFHSNL